MREYSIGKRLIENYVQQPFSWFLNQHSAELGKQFFQKCLSNREWLKPINKNYNSKFYSNRIDYFIIIK